MHDRPRQRRACKSCLVSACEVHAHANIRGVSCQIIDTAGNRNQKNNPKESSEGGNLLNYFLIMQFELLKKPSGLIYSIH